MDRASASGAEGRRFESCRARHCNVFRQRQRLAVRVGRRGKPDTDDASDSRVAQAPTNFSMTATERRLAVLGHESGNATDAQLLAFEDTWRWGPSAEGRTPT